LLHCGAGRPVDHRQIVAPRPRASRLALLAPWLRATPPRLRARGVRPVTAPGWPITVTVTPSGSVKPWTSTWPADRCRCGRVPHPHERGVPRSDPTHAHPGRRGCAAMRRC
jgi:hypothetical protein